MNREDRRGLQRKLKDKKARILMADAFKLLGDKINDVILDGDLVTLNVEQIIRREDYSHMQEGYRKFVEANRGKVFVARPHHKRPDGFSAVIELDGVEDWVFWYGDLIHVKDTQAEEGG